jgi:hypothetical protein
MVDFVRSRDLSGTTKCAFSLYPRQPNNDNLGNRREKMFQGVFPGSRNRTETVSRRDIKQPQD